MKDYSFGVLGFILNVTGACYFTPILENTYLYIYNYNEL